MTDAAKAGSLRGEAVPGEDKRRVSTQSTDPPGGQRTPGARRQTGLSDQTQMRLGSHLRMLYDSVLQQPVPDRFRDLIDRLDSEQPKTL